MFGKDSFKLKLKSKPKLKSKKIRNQKVEIRKIEKEIETLAKETKSQRAKEPKSQRAKRLNDSLSSR